MNELALFAGAGGGILGTRLLGWRVVCAVEIDPYCREVLLRRQEEGQLDPFPIWDDVRTFDGRAWRGKVDVVSAGFPCQPFSVAGKQRGEDDERNMWPETIRVIRDCAPAQVLLENVPGIRRYLPVIVRDLRRLGYTVKRPLVVAAAAVGAGHLRRRVWIYAYTDEVRQLEPKGSLKDKRRRHSDRAQCALSANAACQSERLADDETSAEPRRRPRLAPVGVPARGREEVSPNRNRRRQRKQPRGRARTRRPAAAEHPNTAQPVLSADDEGSTRGAAKDTGEDGGRPRPESGNPVGLWWESEPRLARLVRRPAYRVERIAATGNIQVPLVVATAWRLLTEEGQGT